MIPQYIYHTHYHLPSASYHINSGTCYRKQSSLRDQLSSEIRIRPQPCKQGYLYSVRMTEYESVLTLSLFILDSKLILHFDLPVFPRIVGEESFITFLLLFTFPVIGSYSVDIILPRLNLSSYCFGSSSTAFSILTIFSFFSSLHFVS